MLKKRKKEKKKETWIRQAKGQGDMDQSDQLKEKETWIRPIKRKGGKRAKFCEQKSCFVSEF